MGSIAKLHISHIHACLQILCGHNNEVWFVRFSNNGDYLASSSSDCTAIIWKVWFDAPKCHPEINYAFYCLSKWYHNLPCYPGAPEVNLLLIWRGQISFIDRVLRKTRADLTLLALRRASEFNGLISAHQIWTTTWLIYTAKLTNLN